MTRQNPHVVIRLLLSQESLPDLVREVMNWYGSIRNEPELARAISFDHYMEAGDWQRARQTLERTFGHGHPCCGSAIEILDVAAQCQRLLKAGARRSL